MATAKSAKKPTKKVAPAKSKAASRRQLSKAVKKPTIAKKVARKAPKKSPNKKTNVKTMTKNKTSSATKKVASKSAVKKSALVKKPVAKSKMPLKAKVNAKPVSKSSAKPVTKKAANKVKATVGHKPTSKKTSTAVKSMTKPKAKSKIESAAKKPVATKQKTNAKYSGDLMKNDTTQASLGAMGISPYERRHDENYMNDEQLQHFEKILRHWKNQLMQEVDTTIHHMQDDAANFADPNDRATQEEEFSLELRARDRERKLIKKIDEALQKIDAGDYGFCDECGVDIGIRRLEARPTATLCIDCKTLDEIKERQVAQGNM